MCFPYNYLVGNSITIPRSKEIRDFLARNGLMGKIRLSSSMTEEEIMSEIRSVFSVPMKNQSNFAFKILQPSGGSSKSLSVPALSSSFKWTASAIAGKNSKMPIYVLASDELEVSYIASYNIILPTLLIQIKADTVSSEDDDEYLPECYITKGKSSNVPLPTLGSSSGSSTPELPVAPVSIPSNRLSTRRISTDLASTQRASVLQSDLSIPGPSIGNHSYRLVKMNICTNFKFWNKNILVWQS